MNQKPINEKQDGDCGYVAFYEGKRIELYAPTQYEARQRAVSHFKPNKKKTHLVHVHIAELADGTAVVHTADF